jgi:hypothetical protein
MGKHLKNGLCTVCGNVAEIRHPYNNGTWLCNYHFAQYTANLRGSRPTVQDQLPRVPTDPFLRAIHDINQEPLAFTQRLAKVLLTLNPNEYATP